MGRQLIKKTTLRQNLHKQEKDHIHIHTFSVKYSSSFSQNLDHARPCCTGSIPVGIVQNTKKAQIALNKNPAHFLLTTVIRPGYHTTENTNQKNHTPTVPGPRMAGDGTETEIGD